MDIKTFSNATNCFMSDAKTWSPAVVGAITGAGIRNRLDVAKLLALMATHTDRFRVLEESFNYHGLQLRRVFIGRFSPYQASMLGFQMLEKEIPVERQRAIANLAYGGRLGNTAKDDGWTYRGRGLLPVRGKRAYKELSDLLGVDLVAEPDLLLEPETAARAACALFLARKCVGVRKVETAAELVGLEGEDVLENCQANYRKARAVL